MPTTRSLIQVVASTDTVMCPGARVLIRSDDGVSMAHARDPQRRWLIGHPFPNPIRSPRRGLIGNGRLGTMSPGNGGRHVGDAGTSDIAGSGRSALRPYDLSFSPGSSCFRLLAFQPYWRSSDHEGLGSVGGPTPASVTQCDPEIGVRRSRQRVPHPTDGRTTLVELTDLGRSTVEDATATLNERVFADVGMSDSDARALVASIDPPPPRG